jgi:hypothetical protein
MPKEFYTEKDIEDLFHRGIKSLQVTENIILTELAYEKANRLGLQLVSNQPENPPAAPVRPYLSEQTRQATHTKPTIDAVTSAVNQPAPTSIARHSGREEKTSEIEKRIRSAVIARLGNQVDAKLLDNIIHRVVKGVGLK